MKRRLAEVRCWVSVLADWAIRAQSGRWGVGDCVGFYHHIFFNLLSKCSVHSNFFSPFKFLIRSNYCFLHSPFIEAQEMGFPLSSSAVPS